MYSYTISQHILPRIRFSYVSGEQIFIDLSLEKFSDIPPSILDIFENDMRGNYDVKRIENGDSCVLRCSTEVSRGEEDSFSELLRYLSARYDCAIEKLLDGCDPESRDSLNERCRYESFSDQVSIQDNPETHQIELKISPSKRQQDFAEWLERLYQVETLNSKGEDIHVRLLARRDTHLPLADAHALVDLVRNMQQAWQLDRSQILKVIHPEAAAAYVDAHLSLRAAPLLEDRVSDDAYSQDIAVIGGGFSGISTAIQYLEDIIKDPSGGPVRLRLIERREDYLAGGLAYGAAGYEHHVNVPAEYLSLDPDKPRDYVDWLEAQSNGAYGGNKNYLHLPEELHLPEHNHAGAATQRRMYQYYLKHRLYEAIQTARRLNVADVEIVYGSVESGLKQTSKGHQISLEDGRHLNATDVVYATGHGASKSPGFLNEAAEKDDRRIVRDQWGEMSKLESLLSDPENKNILVMGTGLSAMDIVMTASRVGYFDRNDTKLTLLSRSGNLHHVMKTDETYEHPEITLEQFGDLPNTVQEVPAYGLRIFTEAKALGIEKIGRDYTDEEVFFALTPLLPQFVQSCGIKPKELMALLKNYGSLINTTAVPMADIIGEAFYAYQAKCQVEVRKGNTATIIPDDNGVTLLFKDDPEEARYDALISTLPPSSDPKKTPLYQKLFDQGVVREEPRSGIGIDVDSSTMRAIGKNGIPNNDVFVVGPVVGGDSMLDYGHIGPLYQIVSGLREQAKRVAETLKSQREIKSRPTVGLLMNSKPNSHEAELCIRWKHALENYGLRVLPIKPDFLDNEAGDILAQVDGIMLPGSDSNHMPLHYGQRPLEGQSFDTARDLAAIKLIYACEENNTPILGVCRGMQDMNIALFGRLQQRIKGHDQGYTDIHLRDKPVHTITIKDGGVLQSLFGETSQLNVTSVHKQGITPKDLGEGLLVEALSDDGIVEAFSLPNHPFFLGVQFHPEFTSLTPEYLEIFDGFRKAVISKFYANGVSREADVKVASDQLIALRVDC